ncbi:hypothetical protein L9F63_018712, partial [Diploptera punctata]
INGNSKATWWVTDRHTFVPALLAGTDRFPDEHSFGKQRRLLLPSLYFKIKIIIVIDIICTVVTMFGDGAANSATRNQTVILELYYST